MTSHSILPDADPESAHLGIRANSDASNGTSNRVGFGHGLNPTRIRTHSILDSEY